MRRNRHIFVRHFGRCIELDRRLPVRRFRSQRGGGFTPWPWRSVEVPFVGRLVVSRTTPRREAVVADA